MGNNNNAWEGNNGGNWIGANKISELESYKVATIVWGYHVYVAVGKAGVGQTLPCKWEGGNIHDPYIVTIVNNNDTPIDNDIPHSVKILVAKSFVNFLNTVWN